LVAEIKPLLPLSDPNSFLNVSVLTWHLSPERFEFLDTQHNYHHLLPGQNNTISILSYFILFFQPHTTSHKNVTIFVFVFVFSKFPSTITNQKERKKKIVQQRHRQQQQVPALRSPLSLPSFSLCLKGFISQGKRPQYLSNSYSFPSLCSKLFFRNLCFTFTSMIYATNLKLNQFFNLL